MKKLSLVLICLANLNLMANTDISQFTGDYSLISDRGVNVEECPSEASVNSWFDNELEFSPVERRYRPAYFNEINEGADAQRYDGFYICYKTEAEGNSITTYTTEELGLPMCMFRDYSMRERLTLTADGIIYSYTDFKECHYARKDS